MTPAQKLKMGKALAEDIRHRYKLSKMGKDTASLADVLSGSPDSQTFSRFLGYSNPLFRDYKKIDVLDLLVEKGGIKEPDLKNYWDNQLKLDDCKKELDVVVERAMEGMHSDQANDCQRFSNRKERNFYVVFDYLELLKETGVISQNQDRILENLTSLYEKQDAILSTLEEIEQTFLGSIKKGWKSGELKHALLNHTPKVNKRRITLARSVPLNHLYPEKIKERTQYEATDIIGLDKITPKQFQALQFLAHKAQNQTDDEKKMLKIWDEVGGEAHEGFRIVAFKTSDYITHSQGKDSTIVSNKEKVACMKAIDEIKDIRFTIRWEEKGGGTKEHVLVQHPLIKTLNPSHPWTLVKEQKDAKEIKKFQFVAIPERLFEYKELPGKDKKYKGGKVLFDVINVDPDFFTTLKYSDPEIQHVSVPLMKLSLMFLIEGSFGRAEFAIDEEKLLKRIGLLDESRRTGRAKNTLDTYVKKLINHGTIEAGERKERKRIFKFPKKSKKDQEK